MKDQLSAEDWQRIVQALSQYAHNPEFRETLSRVQRIINGIGPTPS